VLEVEDDPEPDPPALGAMIRCHECSGGGLIFVSACPRAAWPHPCCFACQGTGFSTTSKPRAR
jgi:hypothetical protein